MFSIIFAPAITDNVGVKYLADLNNQLILKRSLSIFITLGWVLCWILRNAMHC